MEGTLPHPTPLFLPSKAAPGGGGYFLLTRYVSHYVSSECNEHKNPF